MKTQDLVKTITIKNEDNKNYKKGLTLYSVNKNLKGSEVKQS